MSTPTAPQAPAPSAAALLKATLAALVVAAIVLVTAVLPAEYGIDLVGTGEALGLNNLYAAEDAAPPPIEAGEGGPVYPQFLDFRTDARTLTVPPKQGIEFKYELDEGATMVYSWRANAYLEFDFHTEPEGLPPEASDSFERGNALQKHGGYRAPYDGIHGWYWENTTDQAITLTLSAAGFFDEAMLFLPEQLPRAIEIPDPAARTAPSSDR
jgi:hypothetical protein